VRGRDSSVGIATLYGLEGPGIVSRWGARFSAPVQTGPGTHAAYCTMGCRSHISISYMHSAMGGGGMLENQSRSVQ